MSLCLLNVALINNEGLEAYNYMHRRVFCHWVVVDTHFYFHTHTHTHTHTYKHTNTNTHLIPHQCNILTLVSLFTLVISCPFLHILTVGERASFVYHYAYEKTHTSVLTHIRNKNKCWKRKTPGVGKKKH